MWVKVFYCYKNMIISFAALRTKELRPDFMFKELENGTHDIVDEQPQEWSKCIVGFLK